MSANIVDLEEQYALPSSGTEIWLPLPGFVGLYSACDQGELRSEGRVITCTLKRTAREYKRTLPPKRLRSVLSSSGYPSVTLCNDAGRHQHHVHELILRTFAGVRPKGQVCRHLNDVKTDNRLSNLAYGTRSENAYDAVRNGTHGMARRSHCGNGHAFSPENTAYRPDRPGARICRECSRSRRQQIGKAAA